jgi:uncharacterized protein with HEPN domain
MLDATCRALELAENKNVSSLQPEDETALALVRLLEILGEAASRVTPALRQRHPEVLWRDISDTRNRIIHEYWTRCSEEQGIDPSLYRPPGIGVGS